MIWAKEESLTRDELEAIQLDRLQRILSWVYDRVPFYRNAFKNAGFTPGDLKSRRDIENLPFTSKENLRENYPFKMFAVPVKDVVRVHASSGTTGKPIVVGYTKNDLETWSELVARMVTQVGVTSDDIAQVSFGYGLFTGAFGLHYGLEKVGATVVPISSGNTEKQIMLMEDFGATALISTPSYALHMAEIAEEMGVDRSRLKLRVGLFGSEAWTEEMRQALENVWGIKATDNYGLSEVMGPGVSGECLHGCGMHINEDHFLAEVIDPDTGKTLPEGEPGELVITTLTKEAFPVIRYRTKDITTITTSPCACGRTTARMRKVTGRTDDMLIIRGVNVFPSQIESVLIEIEGVSPHYQIVVSKRGHLDELEVRVEFDPGWFTGRYRDLEALEERIKNRLQSVLTISPKVKLVEPRSIERTAGKAKRVIDNRGLPRS